MVDCRAGRGEIALRQIMLAQPTIDDAAPDENLGTPRRLARPVHGNASGEQPIQRTQSAMLAADRLIQVRTRQQCRGGSRVESQRGFDIGAPACDLQRWAIGLRMV